MPVFLYIFIYKSLFFDKLFIGLFCLFSIASVYFWIDICIGCLGSNASIEHFFRCTCECRANDFGEIIFGRKERKHGVKATFVGITVESKLLFACLSISKWSRNWLCCACITMSTNGKELIIIVVHKLHKAFS